MSGPIHCVVVTPEKTAFDQQAEFVVVPMVDGEAGIGANHAPMIGRLGCGEVRVKTGGKGLRFYVDGGFVQVDHNEVSVITEQAIVASEINAADVEEALKQAEAAKPQTAEEKSARVKSITQAKAKLKVAAKRD